MWLFPKNMFRRAKDVAWSKERSPLLLAYRMISAQSSEGPKGVPEGMEAMVARAAERGRWTWLAALVAVILGWGVLSMVSGLPFLAHVVIIALIALCLVEAAKYAFVAWYCHTRGSAQAFLLDVLRDPKLLVRPPIIRNTERQEK